MDTVTKTLRILRERDAEGERQQAAEWSRTTGNGEGTRARDDGFLGPRVRRTDTAAEPARVFRQDRGTLKPLHRTAEGFVFFEGRAAKPGVLTYRHADGSQTRELIPPEELHKADSLGTLGRKPVTLEHPSSDVTPANVQQLGAGDLDNEVRVEAEGGYVTVRGCIRRADAIAAVDGGIRELSPGYTCTIDPTPGTHPQFGKYDAVQRDRRYNHLALTAAARGGVDIAMRADGADIAVQLPADAEPTPKRKDSMNRLIALCALIGATHLDSDESAYADATQLLKKRKDSDADDEKKKTEADGFLADLKKKNDELQAKVDMLTAEKTTADELLAKAPKADAMMAFHVERAPLEAQAVALKLDAVEIAKLDNAGLRKAIVVAANPDARKDGSPDYYAAAFDMLAARKDANPWANVRGPTEPANRDDAQKQAREDADAPSTAFYDNWNKQFVARAS